MQKSVDGVNFSIKKGEFFGIVGKNGSGKSTLLKLIAGIYSPDTGTIDIDGKLTPFIELGVGFNPDLSGRENIFLNGALLGFSRTDMLKMYDDIVSFAELEKFMDQKLRNYSSGMQVRLAFSIAIRADAPILLLDEVLAVGDAAFQRKCYNYFKDLKKKKKTVVLVTHDMDVVREFCDSGILFNKGKIVYSGAPQDLAREYLKMFSPVAGQNVVQKDEGPRWGKGAIKYKSAKVTKTKTGYKVSLITEAKTEVINPIFGFLVKGPDGKPILGTNSLIKKQFPGTIKDNKKVELSWEFPDLFTNGVHSVDVAITQNDGATVHDWWESAITFNVIGKDRSPYIILPSIKLNIKQG